MSLFGQCLDAAPASGGQWLLEPGSVARQRPGIEANLGAGDSTSSQDVGDLAGVADRAQGMRVDAPERMAARDPFHAVGVIFEPAGVKPGRGGKRVGELDELASGMLGIDAIDGAELGEVAVREIIGAAGLEASLERRKRGGPGARAQDQQVMRQVNAGKKNASTGPGCLPRRVGCNDRRPRTCSCAA